MVVVQKLFWIFLTICIDQIIETNGINEHSNEENFHNVKLIMLKDFQGNSDHHRSVCF